MKEIKMPLSEVIDRYSIARLKLERLPEHELSRKERLAEVAYYREGIPRDDHTLNNMIAALYKKNGEIWATEAKLRASQENEANLSQIGQLALRVRDLNRERNAIKNNIVLHTREGFKDCKCNSETYAKKME